MEEFIIDCVKCHSANTARNLKPSNILVKGFNFRICDFGTFAFTGDRMKLKMKTKEGRLNNQTHTHTHIHTHTSAAVIVHRNVSFCVCVSFLFRACGSLCLLPAEDLCLMLVS